MDPYNLGFLGPPKETAERDLEQALSDRIVETLREPGPGFAFVGRWCTWMLTPLGSC
jgi:predicted nuclease of restriction endonuclease-like (RecB) superfamily